MRTLTKRLLAVGAALGVAAGGAGVAYAEGWFAYGTTTFTVSSGTMQQLDVTTSRATADPLLPGTSTDVNITIDNSRNNVTVTVTAVTVTGIDIDDTHYIAGCRPWHYAFTAPTQLPVLTKNGYWADAPTWRSTVTGTITMNASAPVACQGAGITIRLKATGQAGTIAATPTATPTAAPTSTPSAP
jgi:hypothetical protein